MIALGGLAAATVLFVQQANQGHAAEASEGVTEVSITFADTLKEGEM